MNGFAQETVVVIKTLGTTNYYSSLGSTKERAGDFRNRLTCLPSPPSSSGRGSKVALILPPLKNHATSLWGSDITLQKMTSRL